MPDTKRSLTQKQKRILTAVCLAIFVAFSILLCVVVGRPLMQYMKEPERFRDWVSQHGAWGRIAFVGMMCLQTVIAMIPGEPLEIGAGYAFGALEGTLLCLAGVLLGSLIIFWLVRRFGMRAIEVFFPVEKIQNHRLLQDPKRLKVLVFFAFFIPGTPKDLLTYIVPLTSMRLSTFLLITGIARIPSVITSTIGGDALGMGDYTFAILVFAATLVIAVAGLFVYNKVYARRGAQKSPKAKASGQEEDSSEEHSA